MKKYIRSSLFPVLLLCFAASPTASATPQPGDDCCDYGRPHTITAIYTGDGCDASANSQDANHFVCAGDPNDEALVRIVASSKYDWTDPAARIWFDGLVALGDPFGIDASNAGRDELDARTYVFIYDIQDNQLQEVEFHSSCSQPLFHGDQFGSLLLTDCSGPTPDPLDCCEQGKVRRIKLLYTGSDCTATTHNQDADKVNCSGTLFGEPMVHIQATDHEDPNTTHSHTKIWFEGDVALGTTFYLDAANAGDNKLKAKTFLHITDLSGAPLQEIEFHTSCSQPLSFGDRFGSVEVMGCQGENEPDPPVTLCTGDEGTCPCGNSYPGAGCMNSSGAGALITFTGSTSVALDDFTITASQQPATQFNLFFMAKDPSSGTPFGNGLLCVSPVGQKILRFMPPVLSSPEGVSTIGPGLLDYQLDAIGPPFGVISPGETWIFQNFFRDLGVCGTGFNVTNAVAVTFTP